MRPDPRSTPAKRREHRSAPVHLHRYDLPGVTSFRCVRCGRNKSGSLAIENDDLTRVVCSDCYNAASAAGRQETPARRKPVKPKAAVPPQSVSANRPISGAQSLIDFFGDAGIRVKITKQGRLSVNGVIYESSPPAQQIPAAWTRRWRQEVDAIAWRCASERVETAIRKQARLCPRLKVVTMPDEYGFAVMLGAEALALIRATGAGVRGGIRIRGNFLISGSHWARLAKAVRSTVPEVVEDDRQLPKPVDSRAEWQRQQEASLQKQREAWERRQKENEELQRIRQAQASKGATSQQAAPAAEKGKRAQGTAERPSPGALSPGAVQLLQFFGDAGISASTARPDGRLLLNGKETGHLFALEEDLRPGSPAWRDAVDQLTWEHARDALRGAVKQNARLGAGARVKAAAGENGFAITRDGEELAVIRATRCIRPGHGPLLGNFLTAGSHWDHLARYLESIGAEARPASGPSPLTRRIDALPDGLPRPLHDACMEASRRIRTERRIAFEHPVVLENIHGELTVQPVTGFPSALRVPFSYRDALRPVADSIGGQLLLDRRDPMPVAVAQNVCDDDAHRAWIAMLLGFADLTCTGPEPATPHHPRQRRQVIPGELRPQRNGSTDRTPSRRSWAGPLEPFGEWIERGGSYVASHVRHLSEGREHGPEARDWALQVGIILKPHQTWVRGYIRGVPKGTEIRFRWNAPTELTSYL